MTARKRRISIFGSTGSIGCSTLEVVSHLGGVDAFEVVAITGNANIALLAEQARATGATFAVTADQSRYGDLKEALAGSDIEAGAGEDALIEAAERDAEWVMAGIVGMAGLAPTLAAARSGADIALANKECLVSAGPLFQREIERNGGRLLPVDSEHSAIHQVFDPARPETVERVILTASGGPFRDFTLEEMAKVTPAEARAHPNWTMGTKISIDSASMFNKALEMIEAKHLFGLRGEQIEVVIHPQSVIHSMVGYRDGSVLAQLGVPDMRTAIGYALTWPARSALPVERLDFTKTTRLEFHPPDETRFPPSPWRAAPWRRAGSRAPCSTPPRRLPLRLSSTEPSDFSTWRISWNERWTASGHGRRRTTSPMSTLPTGQHGCWRENWRKHATA